MVLLDTVAVVSAEGTAVVVLPSRDADDVVVDVEADGVIDRLPNKEVPLKTETSLGMVIAVVVD